MLVLPEADAMAKVEREIGAIDSVNKQVEKALAIYYNNDCYKGQYGDRNKYREKFKERCHDQPSVLECWLQLSLDTTKDEITNDELERFKAEINQEGSNGKSERDINAKYIMTLLRRVLPRGNQQFRKERVRVECVAKRSFAHTDLVHIADKGSI